MASILLILTWVAWRRQAALVRQEAVFRTVADFTYGWENWQLPGGDYLYISPACERVTGYRREEFLADPGLMERIVLPEDRDLWTSHREAIAQPYGPHEMSFRIRRRDGEVRWIEHICTPVVDAEGRYHGRRGSNRVAGQGGEGQSHHPRHQDDSWIVHLLNSRTARQACSTAPSK